MKHTKYPNQIDSINENEEIVGDLAIIAIENTLGTNPNGEFSTVNDRLNSIDKYLKSLSVLSDKDYLHNLNFATILSLGDATDGYDIILGPGDSIVGSDGIINLKGHVSINGSLETFGNIDLNNNIIAHVNFPLEIHHATNKQYVDNQFSNINNKLNDITNKIINNNGSSIQYGKGKTDLFPEPEGNKFLKRNIENSGWEYVPIDLKPIYDKFETLTNLINNISKNNTYGNDITVNIGDAIRGEDGIINIDSEVFIHGALNIKGTLDLEYHNVINSADPINPKDLVHKKYVDERLPKNIIISDVLETDVDLYYKDGLFNCNYLRLDSGKNFVEKTIHGIKFPDKTITFCLINVGFSNIILKDNSNNVPFGNLFELVENKDLVIPYNGAVTLFYDNQSSFWRVIHTNY